MSPPCEDFLTEDRLHGPETFYPLDVRICDRCLLVQLPTYLSAQSIFTEYAYFSSFSDSWVAHAGRFVDEAIRRQGLGPRSRVVEIASNDGYLLQHVLSRGIPALGVEPARNIAAVAEGKGIPTLNEFFSLAVANAIVESSGQADLLVANNVFAHVPDLNDFTAGLATLLRPGGLLSIEVAYLVRLIKGNELDTIYHEHFMYYTVLSAEAVLARHGLRLLDVEELETHGGSIRLWVVHDDDARASWLSSRRNGRPALTARTGTRALPTGRRRRSAISWSSSSRSDDAAQPSPATAHRGRATPCSTIAGSGRTSSNSWWIETPTSTDATRRARTSRSSPRSTSRRPGPT